MNKIISNYRADKFFLTTGILFKSIIVICALAMFIMTMVETTYAVQCEPLSNCAGCGTNAERMKCKFDKFANEGDLIIQKLEDSSVMTNAQRKGLEKAKERYSREKGRTKPEDFHLMAKKKDVNCQLVEYSGDGDGICDYKSGETCVEILDDGIGNDDGICDPMNGKKREACAQICDEEAILQDENNIDESLVVEIESTYDGMVQHLEEINETEPTALNSGPRRMLEKLSTGPCSFYPQSERTTYEDFKKARWAAMASRSGADVLERFCYQTYTSLFATWTVGAGCIAVETGALLTNTWWATIDNKESELDIRAIDATLACASQAMNASEETGDQILVVQDKVDDLITKQAIIMHLLNVPPGKRPHYPLP